MRTRKNVQRFTQNSGRNLGGDMTINDATFGELVPDPKNGEIIVQHKGIEYQIETREALSNAHRIVAKLEQYITQEEKTRITIAFDTNLDTEHGIEVTMVRHLMTIGVGGGHWLDGTHYDLNEEKWHADHS